MTLKRKGSSGTARRRKTCRRKCAASVDNVCEATRYAARPAPAAARPSRWTPTKTPASRCAPARPRQ